MIEDFITVTESQDETHDMYLSKRHFKSASDLKLFNMSPLHYKKSFEKTEAAKLIEQEKKALIIGTAIHAYMLEPHKFANTYVCLRNDMLPKADKLGNKTYRLKENREYREYFARINFNKIVLDELDYEMIVTLCHHAYQKNTIKRLFETGESEVSVYGVYTKTGTPMRCRLDHRPSRGKATVDIKTTDDSSPQGFINKIISFGYDIQAGVHLALSERDNFVIVAMEKSEPYISEVYNLDESILNLGRDKVRMLMDIMYWSEKNDYWADYTGFEILKSIYRERVLFMEPIDVVMEALNDFHDIYKKSAGIYTLSSPVWAKA